MHRYSLELSPKLLAEIDAISDDTGLTRSRLLETGIVLLDVLRKASKQGRHVGLVADPAKLDTEIVGIF